MYPHLITFLCANHNPSMMEPHYLFLYEDCATLHYLNMYFKCVSLHSRSSVVKGSSSAPLSCTLFINVPSPALEDYMHCETKLSKYWPIKRPIIDRRWGNVQQPLNYRSSTRGFVLLLLYKRKLQWQNIMLLTHTAAEGFLLFSCVHIHPMEGLEDELIRFWISVSCLPHSHQCFCSENSHLDSCRNDYNHSAVFPDLIEIRCWHTETEAFTYYSFMK